MEHSLPYGYLVSVAVVAVCALSALAPPRRPRPLALLGFRLGLVVNEIPVPALVWVCASTALAGGQGDLASAGGRAVACLAVLTSRGLAVLARRGARARAAKDRQALALLYGPASRGWVCVSANYRLSPQVAFPGHLIDAKRVIAWVREHGPAHAVEEFAARIPAARSAAAPDAAGR